MKNNNKGYSLVELVAVIGIMAVLTGFLMLSVRILTGWNVNQCAEEISGHLNNVKTNALSKQGGEMKIYLGASGSYYVDYVEYVYEDDGHGNPVLVANTVRTYELGGQKVSVSLTYEDGTHTIIEGTNTVSLGFNRSSGAYTYPKINDVEYSSYCTQIDVSRGSKTRTILIVPITGKHEIQ